MSAPTTLAKVKAAFLRHLPSFFSGKLLLEAGSFSVALARANDYVEAIYAELFPDTVTATSIDRWEFVTRVPTRSADDIATRRARVLGKVRRVNGPQLARLDATLASILAVTPGTVAFIETMRSTIEAALTEFSGGLATPLPTTAPGAVFTMGKPYPGVIDDTGVRIYLAFSPEAAPSATLTHPDGTAWTFTPNAAAKWYETRSIFLGKAAAGTWTLAVYDASGIGVLSEWRFLASNNIDSGQIYNFYVYRDPTLAGTPDIVEANSQFARYALGHMKTAVAQRTSFIVDDSMSLADREPVGI